MIPQFTQNILRGAERMASGKWQAAAAVFCVKSECGKIQIQRETEFQEFTETLFSCIFNKSTLYTIYVSTHHISTPYICTLYLQCVSAQVPRDLRAGVALHLPRHPQHPPVLRHAPGRAAQAPPHHQQVLGCSVCPVCDK